MVKAKTVNINGVEIKQSVINTFERVGLNYKLLLGDARKSVTVTNRFGYGSCETTPLIEGVIQKVYDISNAYEYGDYSVRMDDFDRLKHFVVEKDSNAYMTCLD